LIACFVVFRSDRPAKTGLFEEKKNYLTASSESYSEDSEGGKPVFAPPKFFSDENDAWLETKAPKLTPEEVADWLALKNYSADAFLAVIKSGCPPPSGYDPKKFALAMYEAHSNDPAVVLHALLAWPPGSDALPFDAEHLVEVAPENPIAEYILALKLFRSGDATSATFALDRASQKNSPTAYYERLRPSIQEMFESSGRSKEGASAWASFSINEPDVSSLPLKLGRAIQSHPSSDLHTNIRRASSIMDAALSNEEVPLGGVETFSWTSFLDSHVLPILSDASDIQLSEATNSDASQVRERLRELSDERIGNRRFYNNGHIQFLNDLNDEQTGEFYDLASQIGVMDALELYADDLEAMVKVPQ